MEVNDADVSLWSLQESGRSERHIKQPSDGDDDDDDVSFSDPLKFHLIKYMYMYHQKLNENQVASNEPRPKEVDGSNLIEPCDPNITDAI